MVILLLFAAIFINMAPDLMACQDSSLATYKVIMLSGKLRERKETLLKLQNIKTKNSFKIAAIEVENNKSINAISEASCALFLINKEMAIPLLSKILSSCTYEKKISILLGLSDITEKGASDVIKDYIGSTDREKVIMSYIYCYNDINYSENFKYLIDIVSNKELYYNRNAEEQLACVDAAAFLGRLGDNKALPVLSATQKWADGILGEVVSESIKTLKKEINR